jgi:ATP-dependent protease ClpP protease subunit
LTLEKIAKLAEASAREEIVLFVTSSGGPTGMAMSFYDTLRHIIRPNLTTIGSGDVDSSGIIVFLAGKRRYVTQNTTLLLHPAGRVFGSSQRFTAKEIGAMLAEDRLKDEQYAALVAAQSRGRLSLAQVLAMMEAQTVLTPGRLVELGLADAVLA